MPVQGKGQIDSAGKLLVDSSGKAMADSASNDRCCCQGTCDHCSGSPASRLRVTFSGISLCPGCIPTNFGGAFNAFGTPPNVTIEMQTYVIDGIARPCVLVGEIPYTAVRFRRWNNQTCTGTEIYNQLSHTMRVGMTIYRQSPLLPVEFWLYATLLFGGDVPHELAVFEYLALFTSPPPCAIVAGTFPNQLNCNPSESDPLRLFTKIGFGGTAVCQVV